MNLEVFTHQTKKPATVNIIHIFFLSASILFLGCKQSATSGNKDEQASKPEANTKSQNNHTAFFTLADAERILGEPANLNDSSTNAEHNTGSINSAYMANAKEAGTGKTGNIYFMLENYASASAASGSYKHIKTMNDKNEGVQALQNLGDEAYFHSDGENFLFILVRKDAKMFRMKVNKITGKTSKEAFMQVANELAKRL